jgi:hypothetical protein
MNLGRALLVEALVLAHVAGYMPAGPMGAIGSGAVRRGAALLSPGSTLCFSRFARRDAAGVCGLRAGGSEDEVDLEAFRDLLNDSWATQRSKSNDGVRAVCALRPVVWYACASRYAAPAAPRMHFASGKRDECS